MKRRITAINVATAIGAWITSKEKIKKKDQETTKEMSKGKDDKSKKVTHPSIIDLLLGSLV